MVWRDKHSRELDVYSHLKYFPLLMSCLPGSLNKKCLGTQPWEEGVQSIHLKISYGADEVHLLPPSQTLKTVKFSQQFEEESAIVFSGMEQLFWHTEFVYSSCIPRDYWAQTGRQQKTPEPSSWLLCWRHSSCVEDWLELLFRVH